MSGSRGASSRSALGAAESTAPLDRASLFALLETRALGRALHLHPQLDSTNDEAHRLAEAGAAHGTLVIAEAQTRGRGRRGRAWSTPPGTALAMSLVLRPQLPPSRAPELSFAAALAVCESARALGALGAQVKWPNDVLCDGRKLSGILAELRSSGPRLTHLVLGIGLNVNVALEELPPELRPLATSLRIESGAPVSRARACATLLAALERWLDLHAREGFSPLRARWRGLSCTLGRRVCVEGEPPLSGLAEDLAEDGALLLRSADGALHRVSAGDVEHLREERPAR